MPEHVVIKRGHFTNLVVLIITGSTLDPFYSFSFIIFWVFFFAVATEYLKGKKRPSQCNKMVLGVNVLLSTFT